MNSSDSTIDTSDSIPLDLYCGCCNDPDVHVYHTPSIFYNRGNNDAGRYFNYGRLEHDILHHVSAAVFAMASASGSQDLAKMHSDRARKLLDRLDELIAMTPGDERLG